MNETPLEQLCASCGYNRLGLTTDTVCPECGLLNAFIPDGEDVSSTAFGAVLFGLMGWFFFALGMTSYNQLEAGLFWFFFSAIGMTSSLLARRRAGKKRNHALRIPIRVARLGFWLCVPGVAVMAAMGAILIAELAT